MIFVAVIAALAAEPTFSVEETIAACAALQADPDRLACFDQLATVVVGARKAEEGSGGKTPPVVAKAPSSASAGPVDDDRRAEGQRYVILRADDPKVEALNRPGFFSGFFTREKYEAKIVATKRNNLGMLFIQLDNGEIWRENRPSLPYDPKAGETVVLDPAPTGGWYAVFPSAERRTKMRRFDFDD